MVSTGARADKGYLKQIETIDKKKGAASMLCPKYSDNIKNGKGRQQKGAKREA